MKRIFQRRPLSGFAILYYHSRRSPKIVIVAGFLVISLFFLKPGFPQNLHNFKAGSEPDGFGRIYWGGDIITMKNLEYCRKDPSYGGIAIYRDTGNAPSLCGLAGEKIEYLFWKGRFCGVCYSEEGFTGFEQVREAAFREFGEVNKSSPDQEYYVWEGKKTLMALEYNPLEKRILFWMLSVSILGQMEQPDK